MIVHWKFGDARAPTDTEWQSFARLTHIAFCDLRRLPFLVKLSRSARAVINQNFLFGIFFLIGGWGLFSFGPLSNPIWAAILHLAGSFIVIFNSARLVRKGEELEHYQPGAANIGGSGNGNSRHEAAGQLTPKLA